jgi:putative colanic acid biosynthesis UDP-glucose lipid carrier transferase
MSIVGPRPLPIGMKTENLSCQEIVEEYAGRHRVKPGITGWAQVRGLRGATNTAQELEARIAYDLYYIDNWSIGFDLWIIFITLPKILIFNKDAF